MSDHQHIVGHFDDDGNPCILCHIRGIKHPHPGLEYEGIIDTGEPFAKPPCFWNIAMECLRRIFFDLIKRFCKRFYYFHIN